MYRRLKPDAPFRSVGDVGPGDFVKVAGGQWKQIASNTGHGQQRPPSWTIQTTDGQTYDMYHIHRFAKSSDLE